jgi:hypothetical protein
MWNKNLKYYKMKNSHLKIQYRNNPMTFKTFVCTYGPKIGLTMNLKNKKVPNVGRIKRTSYDPNELWIAGASKVDYKHKYNFKYNFELWP